MSLYDRKSDLPIPPKDAEVHNTVCQYCTVGCGYVAYTWPVGTRGGERANENAFGVDLSQPQPMLGGLVYTESMHQVVRRRDGRAMHVVIIPAGNSPINPKRDHSSRGATNALTTFAKDKGTAERLQTPLLRVGDALEPVSWDDALTVLAAVIKGTRDAHGNDGLTAKAFDHGGGGGGFENNYAVGKLFFTGLGMTNVAIHNRPAYNSEVWGSRDRGVHELHYSAQDARVCDTLVLWGCNSYETASVFFTEHMLPNLRGETTTEKRSVFAAGEAIEPTKLIVVDPRKTSTVAIAQSIDDKRVLHLRPNLGTDVVLCDAIARVVFEKGLLDQQMVDARTDLALFADYKKKSLQGMSLDDAARITGVSVKDMETAARWMAEAKGAQRRRTLTLYEKGMIWNQRNHDTIAALVQLSVLAGNIGRAGTGCGRQGGHQEGYVRPGYPGTRPPKNIDQMLIDGGGRFYWVVGTNPYLSTPRAQQFRTHIHERTQALTHAIGSKAGGEPGTAEARAKKINEALSSMSTSSSSSSSAPPLFMVVSDLYLTDTARDAHLVLPAAGWGEMNLTSINCNSRLLRLYERFMDPPGEAKSDWEIMAAVAQRLGALYQKEGKAAEAKRFAGFDWRDDEAVFIAGAAEFPDNEVDEAGGESLPCECYKGVTYSLLRELGQQGIQTPVRKDKKTGKLVGTVRRYGQRFATADGKFKWSGSDAWSGFPPEVAKYLEGVRLKQFPFWMTTGRNQQIWQTGYHDRHIAEKMLTVPLPYIELHPDDAKAMGVATNDMVEVYNEEGNGTFQVKVLDSPKKGMIFAIQYHPRGTSNSMTSSYTDPKTTIPWYKGTRVAIRRIAGGLPVIAATTSPLPANRM